MHKQFRPRTDLISFALSAIAVVALLNSSIPLRAQAVPATSATTSLIALPDAPLPAIPQAGDQSQQSQSRQTLPKPTDQNPQPPAPPSMNDLGFPDTQTKPDPDLQARL